MTITPQELREANPYKPKSTLNPTEGHLLMVAFPGHTATHLREVHGVEPTEDRKENIALHALAHGCTVDREAGLIHWPKRDADDR